MQRLTVVRGSLPSHGLPFLHQVAAPEVQIVASEAAGPFGVASSVSPDTAEMMTVTVGCDYKWTIQLFEKLDYDAALNVSLFSLIFSVCKLRARMRVYARACVRASNVECEHSVSPHTHTCTCRTYSVDHCPHTNATFSDLLRLLSNYNIYYQISDLP